MNKLFKTIFITLLALLIILPLSARTASDIQPEAGRKWDMKWADINQLNMTITNYGIFGHNVEIGAAGGYWPAGYPAENYIYGCGIWFGALVEDMTIDTTVTPHDTTITTDTLVSFAYNPNSGAGEMCPGSGQDGPNYTSPYEKVYVSTSDWPPRDLAGNIVYDSTVSMQDLYCHYSDKDTSRHSEEGKVPLGIEIRQTTYAWVGPLKEDIIYMTFEIENSNENGDDLKDCFIGVVADCDIGNESGSSANDLLGFVDTMTLGGQRRQLDLGYQFQLEDEGGWEHTPGIVAFKYMESPLATEPVDIYHDGEVVIDSGQQIGMTAFNKFLLQTDPVNSYERYVVLAGYNHLTYDPNTPEESFQPFPTADEWSGTPGYPGVSEAETAAGDKRFCMSSGPFTMPNGDKQTVVVAIMVAKNVDELLNKAIQAQNDYDRGFVGPSAPEQVSFSSKGMNQEVVLYWDNTVEQIYDPYYDVVGYPEVYDPTLDSIIPNTAYNPAYRKYDVIGYNIYRSRTGAGGTWEKLAQYDLIDDYTVVLWDSTVVWDDDAGDTATQYTYETLGTNTGVPYVFVDSNLTNGLTYYYQITAYDYNFLAFTVQGGDSVGANPLITESAGKSQAVIPRVPVLNYTASQDSVTLKENYQLFTADIDTAWVTDSTYTLTLNRVNESGDTIHPIDMEKMELSIRPVVDTLIAKLPESVFFTMTFDGPTGETDGGYPIYAYSLYKHTGESDTAGTKVGSKVLMMDTYTDDEGKTMLRRKSSEALTSDGIAFDVGDYLLDWNSWPADKKYVTINTNGSYSIDSLRFVTPEFPTSRGKSYLRGTKWYQITWHEVIDSTTGDTLLTLDVWDMQNQEKIPFGDDEFGDIWHFGAADADYSEYYSNSSSSKVKTGLYIPGMKYKFQDLTAGRPMPGLDWSARPTEGDVWDIVLVKDFDSPPTGAEFRIDIESYQYETVQDTMLNNIKVVPNPYVVRCEFGSDYTYRKLYFTNLPNKCTIDIYTLSGEHIETLEHDVEFEQLNSVGDTIQVKDVTNGQVEWDVLTKNDQIPAPGLYLYQVQTPDNAKYIGKFAIIK